jgi:hypothetical protein
MSDCSPGVEMGKVNPEITPIFPPCGPKGIQMVDFKGLYKTFKRNVQSYPEDSSRL